MFSPAGWLIRQTDRNGNVLTLERDGQNRLTAIRDPQGRQITLSYNGSGRQVATATDPMGRTVTYSYFPGTNRLQMVTTPEGFTWQYTYDPNPIINRMLTVTDPRGTLMVENALFDAAGRVTRQTYPAPDGGPGRAVATLDYTVVAGTVTATKVTDPNGNVRRYRCQRPPYSEPPGSGILSHPGSAIVSHQGHPY